MITGTYNNLTGAYNSMLESSYLSSEKDYEMFSMIEFPAENYFIDQSGTWEYTKNLLLKRFYDEWFIKLIDNRYHTIKLEFYVEERVNYLNRNLRFYIRGKHLITNVEHPRVMEQDFQFLISQKRGSNVELREVCSWCGNILIIDKRGSCSACGGSPGKRG